MLNEALISLTGYVATQPVAKTVKPGVINVSMRVAWTTRRQDKTTGEWVDGNTSYVTVNCWRKLATNVAVCLRTGDPVVVMGKLSVRTYDDKDGVRRTAVDVDASSVGHDLSRGVSRFQRVRPQTGLTASEFEAARAAGGAGSSDRDGSARDGSGAGGNGQAPAFGLSAGPDGSAGAGSADDANWAAGDPDAPLPDEPEQAFFDQSAISEQSTAEPVAAPF